MYKVNVNNNNNGEEVLITWDPPREGVCFRIKEGDHENIIQVDLDRQHPSDTMDRR